MHGQFAPCTTSTGGSPAVFSLTEIIILQPGDGRAPDLFVDNS
jgi:hypothetical protein